MKLLIIFAPILISGCALIDMFTMDTSAPRTKEERIEAKNDLEKAANQAEKIGKVGEVISTGAPLLPGPFGPIAAGIGTLITVVGGAAAKRARDKIIALGAVVEAVNSMATPEVKKAIKKQTRMYNVSGLIEEMAAQEDKKKENGNAH